MDTWQDVWDVYHAEIKPLLEDLEGRELRRNHIDEGSAMLEVRERFEAVMFSASGGNCDLRSSDAACCGYPNECDSCPLKPNGNI